MLKLNQIQIPKRCDEKDVRKLEKLCIHTHTHSIACVYNAKRQKDSNFMSELNCKYVYR